jgi:hypothetical protein
MNVGKTTIRNNEIRNNAPVPPGRVCLQELCAAPGRVSVYKSLCCTCTNLSATQELCDAPGRVCLQKSGPRCTFKCTIEKMFWVCFGLLRNRYVCFGCFDDTCSKLRNKLKQTRKFIFWLREPNRKITETDWVQFQIKLWLIPFEGQLGSIYHLLMYCTFI